MDGMTIKGLDAAPPITSTTSTDTSNNAVMLKLDQILAEVAEIRELYDELIEKLDNLDVPYEATLGGGYN